MRTELNKTTAGIIIGVAVLLIGAIWWFEMNPFNSIPPAPKGGRPMAGAVVPPPPPSNMIRHGPVGP